MSSSSVSHRAMQEPAIGAAAVDPHPGVSAPVIGEADNFTAEIRDVSDPALAAAWRDLYDRCLEPNIFMDPDFARPALGYLRPHNLKMTAVFEAGRLVALAPVVPPRLPFGAARVHVHKQTVLGLPLLDKACARRALSKLVDAIQTLPGAPSALVLHEIPRDGATAQLFNELFGKNGRIHILGEYQRAALSFGPSQAEIHRNAKADKNFRRLLRRLGERGALSYRIARGADVSAALSEFLALESRGWKGASKTALASTPDRAGFVKAMAERFAAIGKMQIESLDLDGKAIAMGLLFEEAEGGYFWKIAYDEAYAALSPGALFVRELTARLSAHRTPRLIDSCAMANQQMIEHIWPQRIAIVDIGLRLVAGPRSRVALAAERLRRSLRTKAKQLLRRGASGKAPIAATWRARS